MAQCCPILFLFCFSSYYFHLQRSLGKLRSVVSHKSDFGNQDLRQLEPWNLAQWEILSLVPGKVLWRKCIGGLGAKINQLINQNLCEITGGPLPLTKRFLEGKLWKDIGYKKRFFSSQVIKHCQAEEKKCFFAVFANHPAVHSGGVSRGRVHSCGCWR